MTLLNWRESVGCTIFLGLLAFLHICLSVCLHIFLSLPDIYFVTLSAP